MWVVVSRVPCGSALDSILAEFSSAGAGRTTQCPAINAQLTSCSSGLTDDRLDTPSLSITCSA
jgi:hypothetical protein